MDVFVSRRAVLEKKPVSAILQEAVVRGLERNDGIDMAIALAPIIGKYQRNGENWRERLKRYGRARHR